MISDHELRQILLEDADDAPNTSAHDLLAGARRKVKIRRRARITGALAAIAVAVAVSLAIVPQVVDTSSPEPVEPVRPQIEFPEEVDNGFPVVASHLNETGESAFTWDVELDWSEVVANLPATQPYVFCRLPDGSMSGGKVAVALAFNGRLVATGECISGEEVGPSNHPRICEIQNIGPPAWNVEGDIVAGEPFEVSMWLQQRSKVVDVAEAEFGIAFAIQPRRVLASRGILNTYGYPHATC